MARRRNRRESRVNRGLDGAKKFFFAVFGMIAVTLGLLLYNKIISLDIFDKLFL
jgi:hypothetical protein